MFRSAAATGGASIRYTTDGSNPTETSGTMYSASIPVPVSTTVKAIAFKIGMADSTVVSAAYVINTAAVSITVSPTTASLSAGQTQGITPTVTGTTNLGVTFLLSGAGGLSSTSSTSGTAVTYTAPAGIASKTTVTVTATSLADSTKSAVTTIALNPGVSITVSPTTASLTTGQTQGITPTVTNSTNLGVTYTLTGAGTLSGMNGTSGTAVTYTPPSTIAAKTTVTVTATSSADPTKSAVTTITLNPPAVTGGPITVSPATVSVALNGQQTFTASGQPAVMWSASAGTITSLGVFTAPAAMTATGLVTITATGTNNQSGTATVTLTGGGTSLVPTATAQRFLQQAAFGPKSADIASVQALGLQGWLNQQFAMAKVSNYANLPASMPTRFLTNAVMNPDQLRQRVAFALSQITVVSLNSLIFPENVTPFQELLLNDSFTNYRQIMGDVTLSAPMGGFLNMVNNAAANPALGTVANENYARELMQLFSIGTVMLNQDGSVQLGTDGLPAPTYNQTNVTELARVLTGWTFAQSGVAPYWGAGINDGNTDVNSPMVAVPQYHDSGSKTLLPDYKNGNGSAPYVAPAGLAQPADLSAALDNIFYHPNVGPFIGKRLIQHLVKSNPSPAYISRVAAAFANNGSGVRGDMQAVISAVLMDPEARANDPGGMDLVDQTATCRSRFSTSPG